MRVIYERDEVSLGNFRKGKEKWIRGTVVNRLGPGPYQVSEGVRERSVHSDHLSTSHEEIIVDSGDDTHMTPGLDSNQPSSRRKNSYPSTCSVSEEISNPIKTYPSTLSNTVQHSPGIRPSDQQSQELPQQLQIRDPDRLPVPPKTLNL